MQVTIPPGMSSGQQMIVQAPDGVRMQVTLPPGLKAGQQFRVALPAAAEASAASARVGAQAAKREVDAKAKALWEKAEEAKANLEASQKRALEEAERKTAIRREAEVFRREMEELTAGSVPVPTATPSLAEPPLKSCLRAAASPIASLGTVEVPTEMLPPTLPSVPSPIASVPGSLRRLAVGGLQTIQPLLNEITDLMTFNKINRVLADWAGKHSNRGTLSEAQASAILDSIENQLRWPQALQTLMPALGISTRVWAAKITDAKCLDYDSQPKRW